MGSFRRGRTVKGKRQPPNCKQVIVESVVSYVYQSILLCTIIHSIIWTFKSIFAGDWLSRLLIPELKQRCDPPWKSLPWRPHCLSNLTWTMLYSWCLCFLCRILDTPTWVWTIQHFISSQNHEISFSNMSLVEHLNTYPCLAQVPNSNILWWIILSVHILDLAFSLFTILKCASVSSLYIRHSHLTMLPINCRVMLLKRAKWLATLINLELSFLSRWACSSLWFFLYVPHWLCEFFGDIFNYWMSSQM